MDMITVENRYTNETFTGRFANNELEVLVGREWRPVSSDDFRVSTRHLQPEQPHQPPRRAATAGPLRRRIPT